MNSENWEQLWREQAIPPSAVNMDQFHEQLHTRPEEWERELNDNEWFMLRLLLLNILLSAPQIFGGDFRWGGWLGLLGNILFAAWLLMRRRQRRVIYGDYGLPPRERLDRIERGLRERHGSWTNAAMAWGMAVVGALMTLTAFSYGGFGWEISLAIVTVFGGGMLFASRAQARVDQSRLDAALQRIERARAQLGNDQSPPTTR